MAIGRKKGAGADVTAAAREAGAAGRDDASVARRRFLSIRGAIR